MFKQERRWGFDAVACVSCVPTAPACLLCLLATIRTRTLSSSHVLSAFVCAFYSPPLPPASPQLLKTLKQALVKQTQDAVKQQGASQQQQPGAKRGRKNAAAAKPAAAAAADVSDRPDRTGQASGASGQDLVWDLYQALSSGEACLLPTALEVC